MKNPEESRRKADRLLSFLQSECSENAYLKRIEEIIQPWLKETKPSETPIAAE